MDYKKYYSCTRKVRYSKKKSAVNVVKAMKKKGVIFTEEPNIYKCKYCGGWHLGHKRKKRKKVQYA